MKAVLDMPQGFDEAVFRAQLLAHLGARQSLIPGVITDGSQIICEMGSISATERDTFTQWLKARLGQRGGPTGMIKTHLCSHAQGELEAEWTNCKDDPLAEYQEELG